MKIAKTISAIIGATWLIMIGNLGQQLEAWNYDFGLFIKFLAIIIPALIVTFWVAREVTK